MSTLEATRHRFEIPTMAEIREAIENVRQDARTLWLPVTTIATILILVSGALVGAGMWIARTGDRAASTDELRTELKAMNTQLSTMQGSINALMQMQAAVAETRADVSALNGRMQELSTKLETQDAWIQRLRDDLRRSGYDPPSYPTKRN